MKYCIDCKHNFIPTDSRYRRCRKADAPDTDASLCGEMRRAEIGACGPDARLWEAKSDGQA